jgi:hypothetical protein
LAISYWSLYLISTIVVYSLLSRVYRKSL